jgi:SAM-dependent methyltransferase
MFGLGGSFTYLQCEGCGTLTLADPPSDLERFYPEGYYAHGGSSGWLGRITRRLAPQPPLPEWFTGISAEARILDVGSGHGELLKRLRRAGFTRLEGIDPFVPPMEERGLTIHSGELSTLEGAYDLIMTHHSIEHVQDPVATFREMRRLLARGGRILLRTPLADSWAHEHYGRDWWALDAPRHLYVFTSVGIRLLAAQTTLRIVDESRDSDAMQFYAGELYREGQTLAGHSLRELDRETAAEYQLRALELNEQGTGDFGVFWMCAG